MTNLEITFAVLQGFSSITLVIVTIYYVRITHRTLDLQIDPRICIEVKGDEESTIFKVHNTTRCHLEKINFSISLGYCFENSDPHPIRKCIWAKEVKNLKPRQSREFNLEPYLAEEWMINEDREAPNNTEIDMNSIKIRYSFIRKADYREFCFQQGVLFGKKNSTSIYFMNDSNPEEISSIKSLIYKRTANSSNKALGENSEPLRDSESSS